MRANTEHLAGAKTVKRKMLLLSPFYRWGNWEISQHLKTRIWPKQPGCKLSTTHILTMARNLHVKPCSNQRFIKIMEAKQGIFLADCINRDVHTCWCRGLVGNYTHSSSTLGLQAVLQIHHLIPHLDPLPQFPQTPSQPPLKKCSLSSEDTKLSLSIRATNKFQSCFPGVITGSFWLNLKSFPWNSPNYIYKMSFL